MHAAYKNAFRWAFWVQVVTALFVMLIADFGVCLQIWLMSLTVFWVVALLVVKRRPNHPTRADLALLRIGFLLLLVLVPLLAGWVWHLRGF